MDKIPGARVTFFDAQSSAQTQKVRKRPAILARVGDLMQRKRTRGYLLENVFADDVSALARWKSASQTENPPKKKKLSGTGGSWRQ